MLQTIREWSQGILAWIVVLLVCISFALWGLHSYIEGGNASTTVATVNGVVITQRQLHAAYERLMQQQQVQLGAAFILNPETEKQLKQQALQQLIFNEVLVQAAIKQKFRFTPEQEEVALRAIPAFQVNGQFSPVRFQEVLAKIGFTGNEFLADLRGAMLINQLRTGLIASAFALPTEVEHTFKLIMQKRDIVYSLISHDRFIDQVKIPTEAIQTYYDQHQEQFKTVERVSIEYLPFSLLDAKKRVHVDQKELQQFYSDNLSNFTKVSPDKKGVVQPFEKVKSQVEQMLIQQKAEHLYADLAEKASNITYSNSTSLKPAAEALGFSVKSTELFSKQGGIEPLTRNPKILAAAFSSSVLTQGNNSDLIELDGEHALVFRIKEHEPAKVRPLSEVSNIIRDELKETSAQQEVRHMAEAVADEFRNGASEEQLAKKFHLTWNEKKAIGRYDKSINPIILNQAFHLPHPTPERPLSAAAFLLPNGNAVVVRVIHVIEGDPHQMTAQQQRVYQAQIEQSNGQSDYERYISSAFKKAKIKIEKEG